MGAREQILEGVRTSGRQFVELPEIPNFAGDPQDLSEKFESAIKMVAGSVVRDPPKDFDQFLRDTFPNAKTICSTAPEVQGNLRVEDIGEWSNASRIDVTVVRSPLGVAATGSVLLSEEEFVVNTIGFFAHDIIILLDPKEIVPDIHAAYHHPHFTNKAYAVLMTGPSGSADIGRKTVHPAQGVMTLTVIYWPRNNHTGEEATR
jgi:L-lactate dehydrogenase complex protein LldG